MHLRKPVRIEDGLALVLPGEMLNNLKQGSGDAVFLSETGEGLVSSVHSPVVHEQLKAGREFIRDYRDALHMLGE
ncbi:MAG TPA: AbrB/MazE/SpoVT family DNA-binding domain-containing protein [Noviherbaspirillum sp.]|nr:AbrB/MazE/SpoVT family DNA-binding domain-containing protein [Noviherbaspirillum sp.]